MCVERLFLGQEPKLLRATQQLEREGKAGERRRKMPGQGFTVVTGAPRHRAGERWIENWGQWWGKRAGVESCVCFCHHLVLLQFPAFSTLSWRDEQAKAKLWQSCTHQHPSQEDATQLSVGTIQERCWSWLRDALTGKLSRGWIWSQTMFDIHLLRMPCSTNSPGTNTSREKQD